MRKVQKFASAEEDDGPSKSAISLSSSDDEEANKDMTLGIVERARKFEPNRNRASNGDSVVIPSDCSDDRVKNGTVKEEKKKRKLREKKKTKKRDAIKDEAKDAPVDVFPREEEPVDDVCPMVTKVTGESGNVILRKLLRGPRYFDPCDGNLEACFNCGEEGHRAVECTEERRKRPCFVCGVFGHNAKNCTQGQDCFICRRRGHIAKNCPDKHNVTSTDTTICLRCGDLGHDMLSCSNGYAPDDLKGIQCYVCKDYGHLCCVDLFVSSAREVSCYNCAQSGHCGLGCAKLRGETNEICYKCGEEGHFARGCTNYVKVSCENNQLCYKCGEEGHFARGCTNYAKLDRWEAGSTPRRFTGKYQDSRRSRSVPRGFGRASKKKNSLYDDGGNKSSTGKSRIRGGWIVDDPGDLPKRRRISKGWKSPSTPVSRKKAYSSGSQTLKKHKPFTETSRNQQSHDVPRFHKSRSFYERT